MKNYLNNGKIAIYFHWPFCSTKCPYCDFNSYTFDFSNNINEYCDAFIFELEKYLHQYNFKKLDLISIFFGGGTPSLAPVSFIEKLSSIVKNYFQKYQIETTLEANPTTFEANLFSEFKSAGINRLSLGVQSFDDDLLKFLGRNHNSNEAIKAIYGCSEIFNNFSFDLIYGMPNQKINNHISQLNKAIEFNPNHISAYQLTIEPKTAFFRRNIKPASGSIAGEFFENTAEILNNAGFNQYEISNFAKKNKESQHNLAYWLGYDYLGIGPGAVSRFFDENKNKWIYLKQTNSPKKWLEKSKTNQENIQEIDHIELDERALEITTTSLRTNKGLDINIIKKHQDIISNNKIDELITNGFIYKKNNHIIVSKNKLAVTDSIISYILK